MFVSIDIGGTKIRLAKAESLESNPLQYQVIYRGLTTHNYDEDFENIVSLLKKETGISHIAIGVAWGAHLPEWDNKDFIEVLKKTFNCEVYAQNDAVMGGLGEAVYGQANKYNEFIFITWGTGIGAALVSKSNGKWVSIKIDHELYFKNIEELCGGGSLELKYQKSLFLLSDIEWGDVFKNFENELNGLSRQLGNKPIVIGGGATAKQTVRFNNLSEKLKSAGINLTVSKLEDDGGLLGGFAYIKNLS